MNNNTLKKNNLLIAAFIFLGSLSVPFFASAQVAPAVYTGSYTPINDYSAVKVIGRADTGGDVSADVWLEWGTGSSYLSNRTSIQTITTFSNVIFYISNISQDVKYYYRVVARNSADYSYGSTTPMLISEDNIINPPANTTSQTSNTTPNYNYNYNYNPGQTNFSISGASPLVVTHLPENITTTSATLKGLALPGGNITTNGWFEWGETISLGKETIHNNIGNSTSMNFFESLSGLSPNTIYYYRAVIQNQRGLNKGNILSFRTVRTTYSSVPTSSVVPTPPTTTPSDYNKPKEQKKATTEVKEKNGKNEQLAETSSAGGFFPNTLIGWLLFIILLLIITALSDYLYGAHKKRKEEKEKKTED
jgi:hypothetical protein